MPQLLALEWDSTEVRVAGAGLHGTTVVVEEAFAVPLETSDDDESPEVGGQIAAALAAHGIHRAEALLSVGRSSIELRQLSLPPAPDDEMPDMVRFQAMREFNELDENWRLDFVPINDPDEGPNDGPREVLAAAIDAASVEQIEATCHKANLKAKRLILRPCAAASLFERARSDRPSQLTLLVDLLSDEADLTVIDRGGVVFLRTTRLGGDPIEGGDQAVGLLGEIRRTIAAAQNQLGSRVEAIALCGAGDKHEVLAELIGNQLRLPTELFDPFEGLEIARRLRDKLPDHPGRFTPLLGILACELEERPHAIDFLHPRKKPKPPSKHRRLVVPAICAVLLIGLFLFQRQMTRGQLLEEIGTLQQKSNDWDDAINQAQGLQAKVGDIEKWTAGDMVWLDELSELSEEFPPAKEAMLTGLTVNAARDGGQMRLEGLVDAPATIDTMEKQLRDPTHHVEGEGSHEDSSHKRYSWHFDTSVHVDKEGP